MLRAALAAFMAWLALKLLTGAYRLDPPTPYDLMLWSFQLRMKAMVTNLGSSLLPAFWNFSTAVRDAAASMDRWAQEVEAQRAREAEAESVRQVQRS